MKSIILLFFIILFGNLFSQDTSKIRAILKNELKLVDMYFNDRVFINISSDIDTNNVKIEYIKYFNQVNCNDVLRGYEIVEVGAKTPQLMVQDEMKQSLLDSSVFKYIFVKHYDEYYKLFGFVSTDIAYLNTRFEKKQFRSFLTHLSRQLIHYSILKKSEGIVFKQSLLRSSLYYNRTLHRPINIINNLYSNHLYQSTIIDYNWIKPIRVN